jgi:predicted NBD/HSP70 family sugar kinase
MPRAAVPSRPTLDLLRHLSDRHVLTALVEGGSGSRADLAQRTGLSKPTVGQSVGRLLEAGVLLEEGPQEHAGRGRVGTLLALAPGAGCGAVFRAGATGLVGELVLVDGSVVAREEAELVVPVSARALGGALRAMARRLLTVAPGPVRSATVSIADRVDRLTGRTVHLPAGPFLLESLDVPRALAALPITPVVDNDVNWSALAEQRVGVAAGVDNAVHVHLGAGIGAAIVADGRLIRGARGFAGEIAYAVTSPEESRADQPLAGSLLARLGELGLQAPDGTAIDPARIGRTLERGGLKAQQLLDAVTAAVRGACHLLDPEAVVLSGPWGVDPEVAAALEAAVTLDPAIQARVLVSDLADGPLDGARIGAVDALLEALAPTSN